MITASLILNIAVLIPVCLGLITDNKRVQITAGVFTPGRGVLLALYLTILIASSVLLIYEDSKFVFALLFMQIVYKYITPFTVKTIKNPIVVSNLIIASFHLMTVTLMLQNGDFSF